MISGCSALPPRLPEQAFREAVANRQYQSLGERPQTVNQRVYVRDRPTGITIR
jgi:hypothetical protein